MPRVTIISVSLGFKEINNFLAAVSWLMHKLSYFNTIYTKYLTILYLLVHHVFFKTTPYLHHWNTIRIPLKAAYDWIVVRPAQHFQDQLKKIKVSCHVDSGLCTYISVSIICQRVAVCGIAIITVFISYLTRTSVFYEFTSAHFLI